MTDRRVALVTGGGSGIGLACALTFARSGMNLAITYIHEASAQRISAQAAEFGSMTLALHCDVANESDVQQVMKRIESHYHRLDVLVTAAGIDLHKDLEGTSVEEWERVIGTNLNGSFLCIKHARRLMVSNRYGRIVCVGSTSGVIGMGYPAYSASKAGLLGLVRSAARELAQFGITANVVVPGPTETPLTTQLWHDDPARRARLVSIVPVGRVADVDEIARAIEFLASERSGFITGSELVIDGGLTSILKP